MIDLHYWPTPNGKKVSILLEECGIPTMTTRKIIVPMSIAVSLSVSAASGVRRRCNRSCHYGLH